MARRRGRRRDRDVDRGGEQPAAAGALSSTRSDPARRIGSPTRSPRPAVSWPFIAAFEDYDIDRLVQMFTEGGGLGDAALHWLVPGPSDIVELIHDKCPASVAICGCCR